ncbi:MAG TPA: hemolysin family protein [Bacteroidales bacterium]|nr:hemolysin family protein [Bacteroidales bacterium]HSA44617.1 hemolysin family protein [Bacteroidales bacterium]
MDNAGIIIITILLSALFSGLEIAFISANKLKIEVDRNKGKAYARILTELTRTPSRFIGSMLVANNIVVVIYGLVMERMLYGFLSVSLPDIMNNALWILILQALVSSLVILLFGEFIPKTLFRINPNGTLRFFTYPARLFNLLLYPVVYLFTSLSETLLRKVFKVAVAEGEYVFSMVDLDNYLKEFSSSATSMQGDQGTGIQMFQNAMDFRNAKIRECMVPRTEIRAVEDDASVADVISLAVASGHSKILVYHQSIDNITGYVHSFDLFGKPAGIQEIIKEVMIMPEAMPANRALQAMLKERKSIAVVVDEVGGTSGIVTVEDIIEEILGEIDDEYDVARLVERRTGHDEYLFSGRIEIDYLNSKYRLGIPESEDYETLAGFIISVHSSIPGKDDEIIIDPWVFTIIQASENRIGLVKMKLKIS